MYQFSRAMYRELSPHISCDTPGATDVDRHLHVLRACESTVARLARDRHHFARPERTLFQDIRAYFPMVTQERVYRVISMYLGYAQQFLAQHPFAYYDVSGQQVQCRATTRKGTPCQRMPLPHNGYCPSHQHLAETEDAGRGDGAKDLAAA